jgi:Subtilase family
MLLRSTRLPGAPHRYAAGSLAAPVFGAILYAAAGLEPVAQTSARAQAETVAVGSPALPRREERFGSRAGHLAFLGVDRWHAAGHRGQGIKIAVLDWGFRGYREHLGGALPQHVTVHSCRPDGNLEARNSQHGILCAEVLHALAPDAELLFVNWEQDQPQQFLQAVRWARQQGARILTCSLIMPSWSDGEGGGSVQEALARQLQPADAGEEALCFASAGNIAQRHWTGRFHAGAQGFHEWQPGQTENALVLWQAEQVSVEACWRPGPDYAIAIVDQRTREEVKCQLQRRQAQGCAVLRFEPVPGRAYVVRLRLLRGVPGRFHLVALGAGLQYTTIGGSIPFPADGPAVIAVGAVSPDGRRLYYSSCGAGTRRPKPELVAPVPFASLWRAQPFSGTSAAAPQAAALAALLWSRYPRWTAGQVREALFSAAHDVGPPGPDSETGFGMIALPD